MTTRPNQDISPEQDPEEKAFDEPRPTDDSGPEGTQTDESEELVEEWEAESFPGSDPPANY